MDAGTQFFGAARTLATHTGNLHERLADAYADHLLLVTMHDLPEELQASFRELEERLNSGDAEDDDDDPFAAAAGKLSDEEVHRMIDVILVLYGRLAAGVHAK
jgi:hypothetical protein